MHARSNTPKVLSPSKISDPREPTLNFRPMPNFEPTQKTYLPTPNFARPMQPRQPMQILTHVMQNSVRHCASSKLSKSKESNFQYYIKEKENSCICIKN